jgi:hypothetical protein
MEYAVDVATSVIIGQGAYNGGIAPTSSVIIGQGAIGNYPAPSYASPSITTSVIIGTRACYNGQNKIASLVAVGYEALYSVNGTALNGGDKSVAIGYQAFYSAQNIAFGTAVGYQAGYNQTAQGNTWFGYQAGYTTTSGNNNVAFGYQAFFSNLNGTQNAILGDSAAYSNASGNWGVAVGFEAMYSNTSGTGNTVVGYQALRGSLTASNCVAVGYQAGYVSTGANNTFVGYQAGVNTTTGTNVTCIGYQAQAPTATTSNVIVLGNTSIAAIYAQVTSITAISDARDKKFISPITLGVDFIKRLNPVTFTWSMRGDGLKDIDSCGFIAQDVLETTTELGLNHLNIVDTQDENRLRLTDGKLLPFVVQALKELIVENEELMNRINAANL